LGNLIFLITFLFGCFANAQETNLLKNGNFEARRAEWVASGGAFLTDSATQLYGKHSGTWDASALNQTLSTSAKASGIGLIGRKCAGELKYQYSTGASADYKIQAFLNGTTVVAEADVASTTSPNVGLAVTAYFDCPTVSTDTLTLRLIANVANPGLIRVDNAFIGSDRNSLQLSQTTLVARASFAPTADCDWPLNSATFADFPTDASCPAITVAYSSQTVTTTDTDLPQIVFPSLSPGAYVVRVTFTSSYSSAVSNVRQFRVTDGATSGPICVHDQVTATGGNGGEMMSCSMYVNIANASAKTFKLQALEDGAGSVNISNTDGTTLGTSSGSLSFEVVRYPLSSAEALTFETTAWRYEGSILGTADVPLTTSLVTMSKVTNANLTLTNNVNTCEITCDAASSTGTTCAGTEQVGVTCNVPTAGTYDVEFTVPLESITSESQLKLVTTAEGSDTVVLDGNDITYISDPSSDTDQARASLRVKGTFALISGRNSIKLYGSKSGGTGGIVYVTGFTADPPIYIRINKSGEQLPAPIFTALQNLMKGSTSGNFRTVTALITVAASVPTITAQDGAWISSVVDNGAGDTSLNLGAQIFSSSPNCQCTSYSPNLNDKCSISSSTPISSTFVRARTSNSTTGGALDNIPFFISCTGPQ